MRGVLVVVSLCLVPAAARAQSPLDGLRPLLGTWTTEDTYYPEQGAPLVERGVRDCRLVLRDRYLQCETTATNARGVERTYWFLINHNAVAGRIEMLSLWSNVPFKAVHQVARGAGDAWRITGLQMIGDTEENRHYSDLVFHGADSIVWTGRRVRPGLDPGAAPVSFVETWRRRNP